MLKPLFNMPCAIIKACNPIPPTQPVNGAEGSLIMISTIISTLEPKHNYLKGEFGTRGISLVSQCAQLQRQRQFSSKTSLKNFDCIKVVVSCMSSHPFTSIVS